MKEDSETQVSCWPCCGIRFQEHVVSRDRERAALLPDRGFFFQSADHPELRGADLARQEHHLLHYYCTVHYRVRRVDENSHADEHGLALEVQEKVFHLLLDQLVVLAYKLRVPEHAAGVRALRSAAAHGLPGRGTHRADVPRLLPEVPEQRLPAAAGAFFDHLHVDEAADVCPGTTGSPRSTQPSRSSSTGCTRTSPRSTATACCKTLS